MPNLLHINIAKTAIINLQDCIEVVWQPPNPRGEGLRREHFAIEFVLAPTPFDDPGSLEWGELEAIPSYDSCQRAMWWLSSLEKMRNEWNSLTAHIIRINQQSPFSKHFLGCEINSRLINLGRLMVVRAANINDDPDEVDKETVYQIRFLMRGEGGRTAVTYWDYKSENNRYRTLKKIIEAVQERKDD